MREKTEAEREGGVRSQGDQNGRREMKLPRDPGDLGGRGFCEGVGAESRRQLNHSSITAQRVTPKPSHLEQPFYHVSDSMGQKIGQGTEGRLVPAP